MYGADPSQLRQKKVDKEPKRPCEWGDLEFTRQGPVRWFSPKVLLASAQRLVTSSAFGVFLDKRELQQAVTAGSPTLKAAGGEVWFDYISDTGDGFDATYSVAWLAAQPTLAVADASVPLPRGELLVLGGDEVYPIGTPFDYENRFTRPFEASLPYTTSHTPTLLAIPGNHDWYDGLTNFTRVFCQKKWIGGRRTVQTRSYFAVELVANWWLWGIDIQFDAYIDDPQLRFFEQAARKMGEGGRVILCTAKPSWVDVDADPESFRNLAYLESYLIREAGGRLMLSLSGDSHHYAHYKADDGSHKLTAGGGGAFLHPTHHLRPELLVPDEPKGREKRCFRLQGSPYPTPTWCRRMSLGALSLPWKNPTFLYLPIVLYLLLGMVGEYAVRVKADGGPADDLARTFGLPDILGNLGNPVTLLLLALVLGGLIGFAKPPDSMAQGLGRTALKIGMGVVHTGLQILVGAVVAWGVLQLPLPDGETWFGIAWLVLVVALGALAASLTMGAYLAFCCGVLKAHTNEAFSAMALTRYKNFLRIHISAEGVLTVYPIGLDKANDKWKVDGSKTVPEASWVAPADGVSLKPHLIESPIVIRPGS